MGLNGWERRGNSGRVPRLRSRRVETDERGAKCDLWIEPGRTREIEAWIVHALVRGQPESGGSGPASLCGGTRAGWPPPGVDRKTLAGGPRRTAGGIADAPRRPGNWCVARGQPTGDSGSGPPGFAFGNGASRRFHPPPFPISSMRRSADPKSSLHSILLP